MKRNFHLTGLLARTLPRVGRVIGQTLGLALVLSAGAQSASAACNVELTSPIEGALLAAPATVTLTATAGGCAIQTLKFKANGVVVHIDSAAPYTHTWTNVPAGTYAITASVGTNNSAPANITVTTGGGGGGNVAPTVSMTAPSDGGSSVAPGGPLLRAIASDSDGTIASVQFWSNGALLGTDTTAPYRWQLAGLAAGTYQFKAITTDNGGLATTSGQISYTVTSQPPPPPPPSTVSLTRTYVYDASERLCKTINPESGAALVEYDAAGNIAWSAEGTALTSNTCDRASVTAGQKTTRTYDARNRVTSVATPGGVADLTTVYALDGLVSSLTVANPGGHAVTTTYSYNKRRLLTAETSVNGAAQYTLGYGYSANGHLSTISYPDGQIVDYTPDALGRATQVAVAGGATYASGISYFPNGAISGFTYGNGAVHSMTPNLRGLPTRSRDVKGAAVILDDNYAFDENGNVSDITDLAQGGLTTRGMAYDGLDRLTVAVSPNQWGDATYTYDALDNLRSVDVVKNAVYSRQYRYNYDATSNRLSTIKNPAGATTFTLGYDVNGNISSKVGPTSQSLVFDAVNRLSQVTGQQTYRYDGQGRRVQTTDADGKTTFWIYSQSGQVLYTSEARRSQNLSYLYLGNTQVATRAVAWGSGATTISYQHTDALGSPVAESNAVGVVTKRNAYTPYGEAYATATIDGTGYTGHVMDQATGLTYMQQRYFDPQIGRFLSVDPMKSDQSNGWNFNRYNYAANNPYRFTDPDGRAPDCTGTKMCFAATSNIVHSYGGKAGVFGIGGNGPGQSGAGGKGDESKEEQGGPGGIQVPESVKTNSRGETVTVFGARPITDGEARDIFEMSGFDGADTVPMDQAGRDLATSMYIHIERYSGPLGYVRMLFTHTIGGAGRSVERAQELISEGSRRVSGQNPRDRNYAQRYAEMGQGRISANAAGYGADYEIWRGREGSP